MPAFPYTFGALSGTVPASNLDANFAAAAFASDLTALTAVVAALPSNAAPQNSNYAANPGAAATLSRSDHSHQNQLANIDLQTGTSYTLQVTDNGRVVELSNAAAIALTVANTLFSGFNCLIVQVGAGQVTIAPQGGATQRQAAGLNKTRAQWSVVSLYVRANGGGAAAEYILGGDMA